MRDPFLDQERAGQPAYDLVDLRPAKGQESIARGQEGIAKGQEGIAKGQEGIARNR